MRMKPVGTIKADLGIDANGKVQKFFTDTCYRHMDKYVPKRDGNLRTIVDKGRNHIIYESPYAHAQYVGIVNGSPVRHYTTAGTGPYWDKRMVSAEMDVVIRETENFIKRGG